MLPAHAGMIPPRIGPRARMKGAPRACGDDPDHIDAAYQPMECSPRMRG